LARVLLAFFVPATLIFLPVLAGGGGTDSGFSAYARRWEMNDSMYMVIHAAARAISAGHSHMVARVCIAALIGVLIILLARRPAEDTRAFFSKSLCITAALFLLSPTQFPWYYTWLLPFLVICPRASLLLLTVLLQLYYLRFDFVARGQMALFDNWIVWLEFTPVWLMLAWEWYRHRRERPRTRECPT
jgi:hypothetical protein